VKGCLVTAILVASAACSGTPRTGAHPYASANAARQFVGCYQAQTMLWLPGQPPTEWYFVLDSVPPKGGTPGLREELEASAMQASASNQRDHASYWRLTRRGIRLYIGDGFQGRSIDLAPRGDELVGRSTTFSGDVQLPPESVQAYRVACVNAQGAS
jgi:hypothetical protein